MVCEWPVDYAIPGENDEPTCAPLATLSPEGKQAIEDMATEFLWRWTDRQFGLCEGVIRPCRQGCNESSYELGRRSRFTPTLVGGKWLNIGCGNGCADGCGCGEWGSTLRFERAVAEVTRIEIDGVVLDPSAYRVDNHLLLVRQDGGRWPYCQNLSKPLGEVGTWAVTVKVGAPVPVGGQIAAGKLACELAKAIVGDKGCQLPQRVQSVTRQGITVAMMIDQFEDLDQGKTGIWVIDSWVSSVTKPDIGFSVATPDYHGVGRQRTY